MINPIWFIRNLRDSAAVTRAICSTPTWRPHTADFPGRCNSLQPHGTSGATLPRKRQSQVILLAVCETWDYYDGDGCTT